MAREGAPNNPGPGLRPGTSIAARRGREGGRYNRHFVAAAFAAAFISAPRSPG